MEKVKEQNSLINIIFVGLIGVLYGLFVGAIVYAVTPYLSFLIFFGSYLIGRFMLKYLNYYTTFHKVLAGIYALLSYLAYVSMLIFFILLNSKLLEPNMLSQLSFRFLWQIFLLQMSPIDWIIMILMPISAYMYLERQGSL